MNIDVAFKDKSCIGILIKAIITFIKLAQVQVIIVIGIIWSKYRDSFAFVIILKMNWKMKQVSLFFTGSYSLSINYISFNAFITLRLEC